jgi:hypothetical protein
MDAGTLGLDLGLPRIETDEALTLLTTRRDRGGISAGRGNEETEIHDAEPVCGHGDERTEAILAFVNDELERLSLLRNALSSKDNATGTELARLVDECDYLWAHFPECAGADGLRPPLDNISFLKRVRAEIEPFAKAFTLASQALMAEGSTPRSS